MPDNLAYWRFSRSCGGNLDEASAFLTRFRLVAGRRNIYAWLFLPAIYMGLPQIGFAAAAAWAAITAAVHWVLALRWPTVRDRARADSLADRAPRPDASAARRTQPARE